MNKILRTLIIVSTIIALASCSENGTDNTNLSAKEHLEGTWNVTVEEPDEIQEWDNYDIVVKEGELEFFAGDFMGTYDGTNFTGEDQAGRKLNIDIVNIDKFEGTFTYAEKDEGYPITGNRVEE